MRVSFGRLLVIMVGLAAAATAPAEAQWVATGYLGTNFGGVEQGKGGVGGAVGHFRGRMGLEVDFERLWHFFKDADIGNTGTNQAVDVDTRATSLMGNLVVPIATGTSGWRPYTVAGAGVIRASFQRAGPSAPDAHQANLALGAGAGVIRSLGSLVGLRLDLRYFRAFADQDRALPAGQIGDGEGVYRDYGFWRVTFGVTFGIPRAAQ